MPEALHFDEVLLCMTPDLNHCLGTHVLTNPLPIPLVPGGCRGGELFVVAGIGYICVLLQFEGRNESIVLFRRPALPWFGLVRVRLATVRRLLWRLLPPPRPLRLWVRRNVQIEVLRCRGPHRSSK